MRSHIIVCGLGHVGYRVATLLLRLGEQVTVITLPPRAEWAREVSELGATIVNGDARDARVLVESGLDTATALVACTGEDLTNIEIVLDVRQERPELPVVARLFDQNLATQFEQSFGVRRAVGMSTLAAPLFAAAALGEQVVASFTLEDAVYVVGRLTVVAESPLAGCDWREAERRCHLHILAHEPADADVALGPEPAFRPGDRVTFVSRKEHWDVLGDISAIPEKRHRRKLFDSSFAVVGEIWRHGPPALRSVFGLLVAVMVLSVFIFSLGMHLSLADAFYFVVTTVTTVGYGDISPKDAPLALKIFACLIMLLGPAAIAVLYSIITDYIITARLQQLLGRQHIPQRGHVIVVGIGNVGFRIVNELHQAGASVVAVERNPDCEFLEPARAQGAVIIGDARLPETLAKAGVAGAQAVIVATNDDATNLSVGLATKQMNASVRTVLRLFDAEFARKVQSTLSIDAAMSASKLASPTFAAAAVCAGVQGAVVVDDRLFIVATRKVGPEWEGTRPSELRDGEGTLVMLRRADEHHRFKAAGDDPLRTGEEVLAVLRRQLAEAPGSTAW